MEGGLLDKFIGFVAMDGNCPYEFIGFGAIYSNVVYEFTRLGHIRPFPETAKIGEVLGNCRLLEHRFLFSKMGRW